MTCRRAPAGGPAEDGGPAHVKVALRRSAKALWAFGFRVTQRAPRTRQASTDPLVLRATAAPQLDGIDPGGRKRRADHCLDNVGVPRKAVRLCVLRQLSVVSGLRGIVCWRARERKGWALIHKVTFVGMTRFLVAATAGVIPLLLLIASLLVFAPRHGFASATGQGLAYLDAIGVVVVLVLALVLVVVLYVTVIRWMRHSEGSGTRRDVTDYVSVTRELRESELQLRLATEMAGIAVWHYDFSDNQMFRTPNHDALYGMAWQPVWVVDTFLNATHPDDRERASDTIQRCMAPNGPEGYAFDFRVIKPDGNMVWLWVRGQVTERDAAGQGMALRGVLMDVSERKAAAAQLARMTRLYATLSECNQAIVRCQDEAELFVQVCRAAVEFGGMQMAWIGMVDASTRHVRPVAMFGSGAEYLEGIEIVTSVDHPTGRGPVGTSIRENTPRWCQDYLEDPVLAPWREQGRHFGWRSVAALPLARKGQTVGALAVYANAPNMFDDAAQKLLVEMAMDISFALDRFVDERQRKQAINDLRASEQHLRTIVDNEPEGIKIVAGDGTLVDMNPAGLAMLEIESLDAAGARNLLEFVLPPYRDALRELHQRVMQGENRTLQFEMEGRRGSRRWVETHSAPLRDEAGVVVNIVGIMRDITEQKRSERRIQHLANFDALTDLPNRNLLADHTRYAIELARHGQSKLCIMFVDLDGFKDINDSLGHHVGDNVLVDAGGRLQSVLRDEDLLARIGGDEFALVLPDTDPKAAAHFAEKLLEAFAEPILDSTYDLSITASIGIAIWPDDGPDLEALSRCADTAMYRAKHDGRNTYRFFTADMEQRAARYMRLSHALRKSLDSGGFHLHYQPQLDLASGKVVGVEALLRWRHPELGDVSPAEFIPVAEYNGLIVRLGEWVLRTATAQLRIWMDRGLDPIIMAVNLSAKQFRDSGLPELVSDALAQARLSAGQLELELTESVTMADAPRATAIMRDLHQRGVRLSIDDFGTGYSSLNYLKQFHADRLKIDQSFVRELRAQGDGIAIVTAIIHLSHSLGLRTVAEGVETAAQLAILKEQGCDEVQGYYFCKPESPEEIEAYLFQRTQGTA